MKTYEAMFLFDPSFATDASNPEQEVARLMERAGAQTIMNKKWEERKLAYEIKGRKRGSYWLTFFQADPQSLTGIERDAKLSESILRLLIQRADHMTEEDMTKAYSSRSQPVAAKPVVSTVAPKKDAEEGAKTAVDQAATEVKKEAQPDTPSEPVGDESKASSPALTESAPAPAPDQENADSPASNPASAD